MAFVTIYMQIKRHLKSSEIQRLFCLRMLNVQDYAYRLAIDFPILVNLFQIMVWRFWQESYPRAITPVLGE